MTVYYLIGVLLGGLFVKSLDVGMGWRVLALVAILFVLLAAGVNDPDSDVDPPG